MICVDWRTCAHQEVAPLLAAETQAWRRDLDWDVIEAWRVVEPARRAGHLPGFIVRDERGRPIGWTAFLLHRTALQVLAFAAPDAAASETLVDAILASPEAGRAESVVFCVRAAASHLRQILASSGFHVDPYRYLSLGLKALADRAAPVVARAAEVTGAMRAWDDDRAAFAELCARAYAGSKEIRAFAPSGSAAEWRDYVDSLLSGPGCGWFRPALSHVVPDVRGDSLLGAVFVTDLGLSTAHVAQVVVDPACRGLGVAQRLMHTAARAAAAHGYVRMTLLVSAANRPAEMAYARLGFQERAGFIVATRAQPTLSTSDAFAIGGESTRR
jgi:ribosomal protein S18 acetylase RimI-like enzyme